MLQFIDALTHNFAYVGHRATGTAAGSFLLTRSGDDQAAGDGSPGIHFPTDVATVLGRFAVEGEDDLPAVRWLPTPAGDFRPILRMYEPDAAVFDGGYELPPIRKK